jgi:phenylacetate-CoA ligase
MEGSRTGLPGDYSGRLDLQSADESLRRRVATERLRAHIELVATSSPFYRERFSRLGLKPENLRSLEDLKRFPLTTKDDLNRFNDDFLAAPPESIADVCLTSATTGTPTRLLQTASDLSRLAYNEEIAFAMAGIGPGDTVLVSAAADRCFMAGLAYFLGGVSLGCRMVRCGSGSPAQIWELIRVTTPTVLVGVPSLLLKTALFATEAGFEPSRYGIKKLLAIGEAIRSPDLKLLPAAARNEELWGAPIHSTYASSEMATTFAECGHRCGGHLRPELIHLEILGDNGEPVGPGEPGEVVVTPLGVTGMPLLRYRTGDIATLITDPCPCGRTTPRIGPVAGRKDQMLKYRGTTLFPGTLLGAVEGTPGVAGGYVEALLNPDGTDRVILHLAAEMSGAVPEAGIRELLRARARVIPEINWITPEQYHEISTGSGKRKRILFIDSRGKQ